MNAQSKPGPVDFDLSRGRVEHRAVSRAAAGAQGSPEDRVVLLSVSALSGLEKAAGLEPTKTFARSIGVSFGRRVAAKLGAAEGVSGSSMEAFVSALALELAISGWGALHLERWGRAMVLVVEQPPALSAAAFAALLEGAVEAATAREVHAVALTKSHGPPPESEPARVLIASAKSAELARRWLVEGASEADVLGRLHAASKNTGGVA